MFLWLNLSVIADLLAMAALAVSRAAGKVNTSTFLADAQADFAVLVSDLPKTGWVGRFIAVEAKVQWLLNWATELLGGIEHLKSTLSTISLSVDAANPTSQPVASQPATSSIPDPVS